MILCYSCSVLYSILCESLGAKINGFPLNGDTTTDAIHFWMWCIQLGISFRCLFTKEFATIFINSSNGDSVMKYSHFFGITKLIHPLISGIRWFQVRWNLQYCRVILLINCTTNADLVTQNVICNLIVNSFDNRDKSIFTAKSITVEDEKCRRFLCE